MTVVSEFLIEAPVEPWQRIGLTVVDDVTQVGSIRLRFVPGDRGVVGWGLAGLPAEAADIDGLSTYAAPSSTDGPPPNAMGASSFDHIIVTTSSLDRTCGAIHAATGEELKRIREGENFRQGFHRLGEAVVEVVETARVTAEHASFGGFVLNVDDLPGLSERLGLDVISEPRIAVQTGRHIASFRGSLGLGVPFAVMTPPPEWTPELEAKSAEWEAARLASRG
jgi:hypothetical protein